ncbi:MAG: hypothetical protein NTV51_08745 [Verrucomicrobia bacterium]|nr:hypothetical protein [Verrucomicrobiota bacterium]
MKRLSYALSVLLVAGCATTRQTVMPASIGGMSRADWVAWQKKEDPKGFAVRYGWIDVTDGVDQKEAGAIADFYFHSTGWMCGAVSEAKRVGDRWKSEFSWGYSGARINPLWVDAKTGAVWQEGGDRIHDVTSLIHTEAKKEP